MHAVIGTVPQRRDKGSCLSSIWDLWPLWLIIWLLWSSWNVMAHGDARKRKWRGNWRMEWVASTLHTTSEHGVSSITTADPHTSAASSRLNWRPRRFKWTRLFRRKRKPGFCACAITFQTQSTCSLTHVRAFFFWTITLFSLQNYSIYWLRFLWSGAHNEALVSLTPFLMFVLCYFSVDHCGKLSLSDSSATRPSN